MGKRSNKWYNKSTSAYENHLPGIGANVIKIVFGLQKGGVGKTTTAISTGASLAKQGKRVLLVDGDPQANLTTSCLVEPGSTQYSAYDLFKNNRVKLADTV